MGELILQAMTLTLFGFITFISSELTVSSAKKISEILGISQLAVGFVLLSIIANLPELSVLFSSIATNNINITIGNIFGSVIVNALLIFGLASLIFSVKVSRFSIKNLLPMIFATTLIPFLLNIPYPTQVIGTMLLIIFFWFAFTLSKGHHKIEINLKSWRKIKKLSHAIIFIIIGAVGIILSGWFLVGSAARIATLLNIESSIIGAILVAIITSSPDTFLALTAIRKGYINMALGEVFGSNLTALGLVLGLALLLSVPTVQHSLYPIFTIFILVSSLVFWLFSGRGKTGIFEGLVLLSIYVIFIISILSTQII